MSQERDVWNPKGETAAMVIDTAGCQAVDVEPFATTQNRSENR